MPRSLLILLLFMSGCQAGSKKSITQPIEDPRLFRDGGVLMLLPGVFARSVAETTDEPAFIFSDTTDARNTFYFTEVAYLDVAEGMEEKMFSDFESVMNEDCRKMGQTCHLVENEYFQLSNDDRVYKMSYRVSQEYLTTYFVASKTRVVKVIVHNISDDGEATVRSMNIDPYFYVDPLPSD